MTACKGLFVRSRFVSRALSAEVIARVVRIDKSDPAMSELMTKVTRWFSDWRFKLKKKLENLEEAYEAL